VSWWHALRGRLRGPASRRAVEAKSIAAAKAGVASQLLAMPGVVSIGVGRAADGTEVIVVGVDGSRPDVEPRLPTSADGFTVEIRRIGPLRAT
jgi:hypothetical protein